MANTWTFSPTSTSGMHGDIQSFTVPATGTYKITAYGAKGGGSEPGLGAKMSGEFNLSGGAALQIAVGQIGDTNYYGPAGGGTFVCFDPAADESDILVIAGGGGGPGDSGNAGKDAHTDTNGVRGDPYEAYTYGGTDGGGGKSEYPDADAGGSGAGYSGNGEPRDEALAEAWGGLAFLNGATGGDGDWDDGGFGGGGAGSGAGGGGGGYSGGGGGGTDSNYNCYGGGGGGSYNNGSNQDNASGVRDGAGEVIIEEMVPDTMERAIGLFSDSCSLLLADLFLGRELPIGLLTSASSPLLSEVVFSAWFFDDLPSTARIIHECSITGTADGLDDISLPMSHLTHQETELGARNIEIKIPGFLEHIEAITARPNGDLVVFKGAVYADGSREVKEIARSTEWRIKATSEGADSAIVLRDNEDVTFRLSKPTGLVDIQVVAQSRSRDGTIKFRTVPEEGLKAGSTIPLDGASYRIKERTTTVGPEVSRMNLRAVPEPEG